MPQYRTMCLPIRRMRAHHEHEEQRSNTCSHVDVMLDIISLFSLHSEVFAHNSTQHVRVIRCHMLRMQGDVQVERGDHQLDTRRSLNHVPWSDRCEIGACGNPPERDS